MKDFYIRDAAQHENKVITTAFVVGSKQIKPKKNSEPYLALTLCDKSGQIEAKMWDNVADYLAAFEQDDFIKVRGLINKYNSRWQLTIYKLKKLEENEVDYEDFLPNCPRDVEELWRTVREFVATFHNPYLKALLDAFMSDEEIARAYKRCSITWCRSSSCASVLPGSTRRLTAICCSRARSCTTSARSTN
jgi:3'-5' exoribonuclease